MLQPGKNPLSEWWWLSPTRNVFLGIATASGPDTDIQSAIAAMGQHQENALRADSTDRKVREQLLAWLASPTVNEAWWREEREVAERLARGIRSRAGATVTPRHAVPSGTAA